MREKLKTEVREQVRLGKIRNADEADVSARAAAGHRDAPCRRPAVWTRLTFRLIAGVHHRSGA